MTGNLPSDAPVPEAPRHGPSFDIPLERIVAACPAVVRSVIAVFRFEVRRTKTASRLSIWFILALFPVAITALVRAEGGPPQEEVWGIFLYVLVTQVVCLLGLLLWVASLLQNELEGRTWIYFAVRPGGKWAILVGKYLNGIYWTGSAALLGLSLSVLVGRPDVSEPGRLFGVLCLLIVGACFGYGGMFALIGTMFPKRAMLLAVVYTLIFECLVASIPAVINQATVQHRLFSMLFSTMDWRLTDDATFTTSSQPIWVHLLALFIYTVVTLSAAGFALRWREYVTSEEN